MHIIVHLVFRDVYRIHMIMDLILVFAVQTRPGSEDVCRFTNCGGLYDVQRGYYEVCIDRMGMLLLVCKGFSRNDDG